MYSLSCVASSFGSAKNFYCCRSSASVPLPSPLEVLRISTVVDSKSITLSDMPLEVLRISTVVDIYHHHAAIVAFGSAKNFYCCRFMLSALRNVSFGSTKNFYCCRLSSVISYRKDDNTIEQSELII